ncbi:diacylglycerol kinase family protein [Priestia koreensis]|nr:diacylglycerol kinase family protein [Priestia koreensis]
MSMDSQDKRGGGGKKPTLVGSFGHAFQGIFYVLSSERNMKIHACALIIVVITGLYVHLSQVEWCIILILIGAVISLELVNTAIEKTVDLITDRYHPLAKIAKDAAAGAVLVMTIIAIVIGCMIFLPHILP